MTTHKDPNTNQANQPTRPGQARPGRARPGQARRGEGEGEGEDEGEHDREVTGLGRACCRRPNDCLCICGPKLLGAVARVVTGVLVGVCSCFIRAVTGGWVKGTEQR